MSRKGRNYLSPQTFTFQTNAARNLTFFIKSDSLASCQNCIDLKHCHQHFIRKLTIKLTAQETADLVKFTEEILNGKFHLLCSD